MRIKYVDTPEALKQLEQVYRARGWVVIRTNQRIEAYDSKGKLRAVAKVKIKQ